MQPVEAESPCMREVRELQRPRQSQASRSGRSRHRSPPPAIIRVSPTCSEQQPDERRCRKSPPRPKPASTRPAIDARVSPASCNSAATCGNRPNSHTAFDEHRAEANLGQRVREDVAVVRAEIGKVERPEAPTRLRPRKPTAPRPGDQPDDPPRHEDRPPAEQDRRRRPASRSAEQVADHRGREQPRLIATCRCANGMRSPMSASAIGKMPPDASPARTRETNQQFEVRRNARATKADEHRMARQNSISRVLLNMSASMPSTGCTNA